MRHDAEPETVEPLNALNHFEFAQALEAIQLTDPDRTRVAASFADPDPVLGLRCPSRRTSARSTRGTSATIREALVIPGASRCFAAASLRSGRTITETRRHPENGTERGLLFVSYQRHIARQFEVLNTDWMNSFSGPHIGRFRSPGGPESAERIGLPCPKGRGIPPPRFERRRQPFDAPRQWVVPTGGAYLFTPSLSFMAKYGAPAIA